MRFLILLFLLGKLNYQPNAQNTNPAHLLWYEGKKIKPNVLLTAGGDSVFFNPTKGTVKVISKSGKGKALDNMLVELDKTPKRIQEMINKIGAKMPKPMVAGYGEVIGIAYHGVQDNFREILSNTFQLPLTTISSSIKTGKGGFELGGDAIEEALLALEEYFRQHKDEKISSVPAPPRFDFSYCYTCETGKHSQYAKDFEWFKQELFREEQPFFQKILNISREAQLKLPEEKNLEINARLNPLMAFVFQRMETKVLHLVEKYLDDPYRCGAVLQVGLSLDRMEQLTGYGTGDFSYIKVIPAFKIMANLLSKAIDEKDYSIALNLNMILSTERQFQLLGETMPDRIFGKAVAFNQFKLTTHISAKESADGGYMLAELEGENWFYALPDSSCKLEWFLVGPYLNKMKINLVAAEMKGGGGQITYVGTKNWNSDIPQVHIDFCQNHTDTIIAYPFFPEGFKEMWQFPQPWGAKNVIVVNGIIRSCFMDVEQVKADYAKYSDPANVENLKKEMMAKYEKMMKNNRGNSITPSKEGMSLLDVNDWAEMQRMSKDFSKTTHEAKSERFLFTPEVHNKDKTIVLDKINGKLLFPQNTAIEYAWYHLTLEHDPDGPYSVHL